MDKKNILFTGPPRCGKSTLIERLIEKIKVPASCFVSMPLVYRFVCSSKALPLSVSRYFCLLLRGLSGIVISIRPDPKAGSR